MPVPTANPTASPLTQSVATLWGVGPDRSAQLARLDIRTIEDLLLHRPRRYEDRRQFRSISDLQLQEPAVTRGTVVAMGLKRFRHGQKSVFELILDDGSARLHCRWWNLPFMEKYFKTGDQVVVYGKPVSLKPRAIDHPETEVVETGAENFIHLNRITAIYPLTEGLPQRWLRALMWRTLETFAAHIHERWPDLLQHAQSLSGGECLARARALRMLHFPEELGDVETARLRLALEEFVALQLQVRRRRRSFEQKSQGFPCGGDNRFIKPFLLSLGFKLTAAQTRVLREIRAGMRGAHPMRRLLQGDVGSGKTAVAACSALMAIESGFNVALMAPTEILAEQHFQNFSRWFTPLRIGVQLRTGSRKTGSIAPGSHGLVVGTHALLTETFSLPDLGLVIIDEQHKFGVAQREQIVRKGRYPHLLVMTATPIPRTLGLTLYAELDISTIDAMPPGRHAVRTFVRAADALPKVWSFVREKLAEGRQGYVVYPRVEDAGSAGVKAVTREYEKLRQVFAPYAVGLLHGRLKGREKDTVMEAFRGNRVHVLLATSLIEVGVDVPNAAVMVIENAEQFGLAQLHQMRGRIGRGGHEAYCVLVSAARTPEARERLRVLEESTDGFRIAEADLKLRGPGELLGQEQSGMPHFRFGHLADDLELIRVAREVAALMEPH